MRFITGPRQSGKTTLAKFKLEKEQTQKLYYLWDLRSVRDRYKNNELFFTGDPLPRNKKAWICFDEIHKMPKWKNMLKGMYDTCFEDYFFIIIGSAKFNVLKKAGDSLAGRYFTFHLFPLCLMELTSSKSICIPKDAEDFIKKRIDEGRNSAEGLSHLLEYSGFPEPFSMQSGKFHNKWAADYLDTVIKEDIGALTRIIDKEYLYDLYKILPEMTGSPVSVSSLASHIESTPPTVKNYLKKLEDFYLTFMIYPYSNNIKRSLLKASKCYLYDWTRIKDPGRRFENYIAVELKTRISLWADVSGEEYNLFYIRNKQKQGTDFLITRNKNPWLLIEAKSSDSRVEKHHLINREMLGCIPLVQLCREENICMRSGDRVYRISASRFLS